MLFSGWQLNTLLYYLLGVFFFYGLGVISHYIYDGGAAKSDPNFFWTTTKVVIEVNLYTILGIYDRRLRAFVNKYPFTQKAFELEEKSLKSFIFQLMALIKPSAVTTK